MKIRTVITLLFIFSYSLAMSQQQSILLNSGKRIYVKDTRIDNSGLVLYKTFKDKTKAYEVDEVFSMIRKDSVEVIFYKPECEDVCFKVQQMRDYLHGLADGREVKMWLPATGAFVVSAAVGAITPPLVSVLAPAIVTGGISFYKPKMKESDVPARYKGNDHYITGFETSVRKKRITTSLVGGGIGLAVGIVTGILISK